MTAVTLLLTGCERTELLGVVDSTDAGLADRLNADLPYLGAEVVWAARTEMARTVEDVLSRRTRALLLNAKGAIAAAPKVAELLAVELERPGAWVKEQVAQFSRLAARYQA